MAHLKPELTRRELLGRLGLGFGALGLADVLAWGGDSPNPLAPKGPHFAGRAKRVIHIFANGGPSHVDTFDPKPALERYAGKPLPVETLKTVLQTGAAFPSPFKFRKHGQSGLEVSELFPHLAESADDLCVIRSMNTTIPDHDGIVLINTGELRLSRPSVGAWVTYGLGSESQNLPGFIVMCPNGYPTGGAPNWRSSFLPGAYQGTYVNTAHVDAQKLLENIRNPFLATADQRTQLDALLALNREHQRARREDVQLEARIQSFELAYRMQMEATDAFDVTREPEPVRRLYGDGLQARQMMIARRLVERGVRFVQVWTSEGQPWDSHTNLVKEHRRLAGECDRAIGALLKDLRQRGMLDDTLVLWGGEFGRTPTVELPAGSGRDHNPYGFTFWMAGGGVRGGHVHGATDEFGWKAVKDKVGIHDLHATILHLLGFDHEKLTYRYAGRDFRLTDVHGHVVRDVLV